MLYNAGNTPHIAIVGWHEGLAGQLHAMLQQEGYNVDCFVNETMQPLNITRIPRAARVFSYPEADTFKDLPLITSPQWVDIVQKRGVNCVLLAPPEGRARREAFTAVQGRLSIASYVHPSAELLPESSMGSGCIVFARAVLGYRAALGQAVILNTGAQVDHHSVVGNFATVMPGATLCGNVSIGEGSTVGAGATLIHRVAVGEQSFVGAGALVRHAVPDYTMVVGTPARIHKHLKKE